MDTSSREASVRWVFGGFPRLFGGWQNWCLVGLIFIAGFKHLFGMFGMIFVSLGGNKNCVSRVQVDDFWNMFDSRMDEGVEMTHSVPNRLDSMDVKSVG